MTKTTKQQEKTKSKIAQNEKRNNNYKKKNENQHIQKEQKKRTATKDTNRSKNYQSNASAMGKICEKIRHQMAKIL